jgi:AraC family transcriptional regulator
MSYHILQSIAVNDARLAKVEYSGTYESPHHAHQNARLVIVLRGSIREDLDGYDRELQPVSLLFRCAQEPHRSRYSASGALCVCVDMDPSFLDRAGTMPSYSTTVSGAELVGPIARLVRSLMDRKTLATSEIESSVLGMARACCCDPAHKPRKEPPWLTVIDQILEERFLERLVLRRLAAEVGLHPIYLSRAFKSYRGRGLAEEIRSRRLHYATQLLSDGSFSLGAVAAESGFCDQSHFGRLWKREASITLGDYRRFTRTQVG